MTYSEQAYDIRKKPYIKRKWELLSIEAIEAISTFYTVERLPSSDGAITMYQFENVANTCSTVSKHVNKDGAKQLSLFEDLA